MKIEKHKVGKENVKKLMKEFNVKTPEEALEELAYREFDLKHNASITLGKVGKTFFEIKEVE